MKTMTVHPHCGVDKVEFRMSRAEVESVMGFAPKRFVRNRYGLMEDLFEMLGLCVLYDQHDRCNAISFARGFGVDLDYEGYRLFSHPAIEVRKWALSRDPTLDPSEGFTSKALGLGMWVDWVSEDELEPDELLEPAMSFIIFRSGYHEEEAARLAAAGLLPTH